MWQAWRRVYDALLPWTPALVSWGLIPVLWGLGLFDDWLVVNAVFWTVIGYQSHRSRLKMRRQFAALRRHVLTAAHKVVNRTQPPSVVTIDVDTPLFCPKCAIDLQANPSAQVQVVDIAEAFSEIRAQCDCGAFSLWTYWPDQRAAAGKVWMEAGQVRGLGW